MAKVTWLRGQPKVVRVSKLNSHQLSALQRLGFLVFIAS